jgi:hypothetical protein
MKHWQALFFVSLVAGLHTPHAALAQVPTRIPYQGRLLAADGSPKSGPMEFTFTLFDTAQDGKPEWSETQAVALSDGYYAVFLGSKNPLPSGIFDSGNRWLEISVGSSTLAPRQEIGSVPYAVMATNLSGGTVKATSLTTSGPAVVAGLRVAGSASKQLTGTVSTSLGNLAVTGSATAFTTELWVGAPLKIGSAVYRVASIADDGTLALASAATANVSGAAAFTETTLLRVDDSAGGASRLYVGANGAVGIGTATPTQALEVNGKIKSVNLRAFASASDFVLTDSTTWVDMPGMSLTVQGSGLPVVISANWTTYHRTSAGVGYFDLQVDGTTVAGSVQQYPSDSSVTTQHLQALQTLEVGSHTLKVRWRTDKGNLALSWANATRSILAFE